MKREGILCRVSFLVVLCALVFIAITCNNVSFIPPLASQIHLSFHHHSHRDNVTAPTGRPSFRSRLHFSHGWGEGKTTKSERTCGGIGGEKKVKIYL